jgi:hypothetical protein
MNGLPQWDSLRLAVTVRYTKQIFAMRRRHGVLTARLDALARMYMRIADDERFAQLSKGDTCRLFRGLDRLLAASRRPGPSRKSTSV